ncbi:hypothetical protein Scep_027900 [Stephania cephalantha]|uniref:Uncharacterized protein n=1 Tax=Stephania cephalantha TaxID=152367 RepID=A0AAP0EC15_9MAGN
MHDNKVIRRDWQRRPAASRKPVGARRRHWHRHDSGNGAVNGEEQLRGGALSDLSILDEGCDSTSSTTRRFQMDFEGHGTAGDAASYDPSLLGVAATL